MVKKKTKTKIMKGGEIRLNQKLIKIFNIKI